MRRAYEAGNVSRGGERGTVHVRDVDRPDLVYVCIHDRPRDELVVVTLWEEGEDPAVPRRFTDALRAAATLRKLDLRQGGVSVW